MESLEEFYKNGPLPETASPEEIREVCTKIMIFIKDRQEPHNQTHTD